MCVFFFNNSCSCCQSRQEAIPSCSDPFSQAFVFGERQDFCPSPPQLSQEEYYTRNFDGDTPLQGRLDSNDIYVNQFFLYFAERMGLTKYSNQVQGGFTISSSEPPTTTCGCTDIFNETEMLDPNMCLTQDTLDILEQQFNRFGGSGGLEGLLNLNPEDFFSLNDESMDQTMPSNLTSLLNQREICNNFNQTKEEQIIASLFQSTSVPNVTTTVWFNNNVSHIFHPQHACMCNKGYSSCLVCLCM